MKRKRQSVVFTGNANQSTLLVDTGIASNNQGSSYQTYNNNAINKIGNQISIPLSSDISSGNDQFRYNMFYWNKDLYTFPYKACCIGVAVMHYDPEYSSIYFVIYPIFLPKMVVNLYQSLFGKNGEKLSPAAYHRQVLEQFVYYLNLGFTMYANQARPQDYQIGTATYATPILFSKNYLGSISPSNDENQYIRLFSSSNIRPWLQFNICNSNNQIMLNLEFNWRLQNIGFNFVSIKPYMLSQTKARFKTIGITSWPPNNQSFCAINTVSGEYPTGWFGQGAYSTGFGNYPSETFNGFFTDEYTDLERESLWNDTRFPTAELGLVPNTLDNFKSLCIKHKLRTGINIDGYKYSNTLGIISSFITSFIPTRFITINSEVVTSKQRQNVLSNNKFIDRSTVGVEYITIFSNYTSQDTTSQGKKNYGYDTDNSTDYINLDDKYSIQSIDLTVKDEFNNIIQSYECQNPDNSAFPTQWNTHFTNSMLTTQFIEAQAIPPGSLVPAVWTNTWLPPSISSNKQTIFYNESWNCSPFHIMFGQPNGKNSVLADSMNPNVSISTNITHFGGIFS